MGERRGRRERRWKEKRKRQRGREWGESAHDFF